MHVLTISLITLGDPTTMTGGYLYHQRMAALAARSDAVVEFVSVPDLRFPLPVAVAHRALAAAGAKRPDVLLLDSIAAGFVAPWLRPDSGPPLVGMLHQPPGGIDHGPVRAAVQATLDRRAYRAARRLLVASEALAAELRAGDMPADLIRVVPPGRDAAPTAVPPGADLRGGRRAALLSVGNWVPRKGVLDLLDAVALLPPAAATLHLVGDPAADPSYTAAVRRRLTAAELADRVVVHGVLRPEEVAGFYAAADVFVLPSRREPYGTAYGEAMAAGLPVVGWRAGNLPHLARDGEDGFAVPEGDVPALAAALRRLVDDAPLRHRMGSAARRRAESFPTWADSARRLFAELRAVAAAFPASGLVA
jgi:glycosyltransferase involved in cell wall biosynthesis